MSVRSRRAGNLAPALAPRPAGGLREAPRGGLRPGRRPAPFARRVFLLLAIAVPAAALYALMRAATEGGAPFLGLVFWQAAGAALLLLVVLLVRRRRVAFARADLRFYVVSALFGFTLPYLALAYAAPRAPVGVLGMTLAIEPAITYLIALLLLLERFNGLRFGGILCGIAGLLLILLPETGLPSRDMVPWVLLGLAVPASWAIWTNLVALARPPAIDSLAVACGLLAVSALMLLPAVLATGELWWFDGPRADTWWMIPAFAAITAIAWVAGFECVKVTGPVFYSVWTFVTTPLTLLAGIVFFAERHSPWIWGALALLFASLYLVNLTMASARRRA